MNIYSGERGLGAALTNPTELAFRKGGLSKKFPVRFRGVKYRDAEAAYQALKTGDEKDDDALMAEIIGEKFVQHSDLFKAVQQAGGLRTLQESTHFTGAKSARFRSWEGAGLSSRFIRNLVQGYRIALEDQGLCPYCGLRCGGACAELGL